MKYKIIYADPPWAYGDKTRGGAEKHYVTTKTCDLKKMDVAGLAADDCVLLMWTTFPKMPDALQLIEAWGFKYKTCAFTWVKKTTKTGVNFWGMGRWTRSNCEVVLLATKGKPKRVSMGVHSVIESPIERHSKKPSIVREKIVALLGDVPRLEMFCRGSAEGWDVFGNESDNPIKIKLKEQP